MSELISCINYTHLLEIVSEGGWDWICVCVCVCVCVLYCFMCEGVEEVGALIYAVCAFLESLESRIAAGFLQ